MADSEEQVEEFEAALTGRRVRLYPDESRSSGMNWEYVEDKNDEDDKDEECVALPDGFPCFEYYLDGKKFDDESA